MRRTFLVTVAALALAAAAPAADGAVRHVIRGAGFGHGTGMSQYGAFGFALEGRGYGRILAHYYRGTRLTRAPARPVRVLLQPNDRLIRVRGATSIEGLSLNAGTTYVARQSGRRLVVSAACGRRVGRVPNSARFEGSGRPLRVLGPALNLVPNGRYRGAIEVRTEGAGVSAINVLDIDSYVRGVVPGEMPTSWPIEALKAQAVTARTLALATRKAGLFDQYPDTRSQVYRGVTGESVRSDAAVRQTAGHILTYGGEPAATLYFSTSGGHTENIEFSFVGSLPKPWLVGVPDPYDSRSPYHRWTVRTSASALDRALGAPGSFKRLKVLRRGVSPRVVRARVVGSAGSKVLTGPTIRARLGLRDTWFTFIRVSSSVRRARAARTAGSEPPLTRPAITGRVSPAPRGGLLIERRDASRWKTVGAIRTSETGRYRWSVGHAGVYRVRAGEVAGPRLHVR